MKKEAGNDRGFTLIETLIAVMVISIAMVGPLTLTQKSLSTAKVSEEQVSAFYLAQDAIEYVKNVRDDNQKNGRPWLQGLSQCLDTDCVIDTTVASPASALSPVSGSYCQPLRLDAATNRYGCNASWGASSFTRIINLDSGSDANREVTAHVTVTYPSGSFTRTFEASLSMFNVAEAIQIAADIESGTTSTTTVGQPPTCSTFFANPTKISAGQTAFLTWNTSGATAVSFSPPIGSTALSDSDYPVNPTATTTYILTATNVYGSDTCQAQVGVSGTQASLPTPIAYWPFETNANDISGNGRNGTLTNGAAITGASKIGVGALSLDGTDDYVAIANHSSLQGNRDLTISLWARTATTAAQKLITKALSSTSKDWELGIDPSLGIFYWESEVSGSGYGLNSPNGLITLGTWYHLAAVLDKTNNLLRLYVNGSLVSEDTTLGNNTDSTTAPVSIGRRGYTNNLFTEGEIDEVQIFDRPLSSSEILDLYTDGLSGSDINPPVISGASPSGTIVANTTQTNMSVNTNENATCRWAVSDVAYSSMPNTFTTTGATIHTYMLTGLTNGTSYTRYIRCIDTSGNSNTVSTVVSFDVANSGTPTAGLVAYWPFDINASDASGQGNNGTFMNGAGTTSSSKVGAGAANLDGVDDYITVPNAPELNMGPNDWSIAFWAKTSQTVNGLVVTKATPGREYEVSMDGGIHSVYTETKNGTSQWAYTGSNAWTAGVWVHVVVMMDVSNSMQPIIYVNGVQKTISTDNITLVPTTSTGPLYIGSREPGTSKFFTGQIDELRLYNRLLTASEINTLYTYTGAPADTTPPVVSNPLPVGTLPSGTTQTNMTVTTNENATCRWAVTDVAYSAMPNTFTTTGSTTHSYMLLGLTDGTTYNRYIRCSDALGNVNTASTLVSFNVASNGPALVAYWPFDNNANDVTPSGYHGTLIGNATISAANPKIGAGSLFLDGNGDYVSVGDVLDMNASSSFSISLWAKASTTNGTSTWRLIAKKNSGTPPQIGYMMTMGTSQAAGANLDDGATSTTRGGGTITVGTWTHLVMVVNRSTNQAIFYTNNVASAATSITGLGNLSNALNLVIGAASNSAFYFNGHIDDVRIYNYALSASEVSTLFNLGSDATAPSITNPLPSGTLAAGTTQTNMTVTTNENATCKWAVTDMAYASMPNTFTTTGATSHSYLLTGLTNGSTYTRYIRCIDTAGNASLASTVVAFSVATSLSNMVAYWTFDSNLVDSSGNGYHGVASGNAAVSTSLPHNGAGSLLLDGAGDYVTSGDITEMNGASAMSVAGWFKDTAPSSATLRFHFAKYVNGFTDFVAAAKSNVFYVDLGNGTADTFAQWGQYGATIAANTWYHVAVVFDGSQTTNANRLKLYINNTQQTLTFTGTIPATIHANLAGTPFRVGTRDTAGGYWSGSIDDLRVYDYALSAADVSTLFNTVSDITPPIITAGGPTGTLAAGNTQTTMTVTTNENATCKWNTTDVAYASMANTFTTTGTTNHFVTLTGLTDGTSYTRYVRCQDPSGNATTTSKVISFSVAAGGNALIGYWPFDSNLNDTSGSGYNGTAAGNAAISTSIKAVGAGSLTLDGTGDYVTTVDIPELNSVTKFTIAGWFRDAVPSSATGRYTFGKYIDINNKISEGANASEYYVNLAPGSANGYGLWPQYGATIPANTWYHAAMVFDGSQTGNANRLKLYVNNVQRTLTFTGTIPSVGVDLTGIPFRIGTVQSTGGYWNGQIDDLRLYNYPLSAAEIATLYSTTTDTTPPSITASGPTGTLAAGTTQTNMTATTNENATCKWAVSDMAYASMPNTFTTTGVTSHSYNLIGLTNGTSYTRYIRCSDTAGNAMTSSTVVSFSVASSGGVPTANLIAYWPFDSNSNDASGSGRNGTFNGNATFTTGTKIIGAGSAIFDGNGDYVSVADHATLKGNQDLSISLWFKTASTAQQKLATKSTGSASKDWEVGITNTTVTWESEVGGVAYALSSAAGVAPLNSWNHVVAVMNKTADSLTLYSNGTQVAVDTTLGNSSDATTALLHIGKRTYSATPSFDGTIDEMRIYNRALTLSEVQALYAEGSGGGGSDTTPPSISASGPSGTLAAGTTQTNMTATTDENATCKWAVSDMAYASMPNTFTTTGATSHSYMLTGLTDGTSYTRYIRCSDTAGNAMTSSTVMSFSVAGGNALIAHWTFDSNYTDASGNGYTGAASGNAAISTSTRKVGAGSLTLDGAGDYVTTADIPELDNATKFSVAAWYRDATPWSATGRYTFGKYSAAQTENSAGANAGEFYANVRPGSSIYGKWTGYGAGIATSTWFHAAMVFDGTQTGNANRLKLYVNNVLQTLTFTGTIPASGVDLGTNPFRIGTQQTSAGYWNGQIDDLRVYNYALTAGEVTTLYNLGDFTAPTISGGTPTGTLAAGTTQTAMTVTTNENATCKWNTTDVAYASMANTFSTTGGTSHSTTLTGLADNTSYTRYVRCQDMSANATGTSKVISFSVAAGGPTGLIAHWKFNEASGNAVDSVNGFIATPQMTIPRIAGPNDGNAADLNGTANSYYSVPDNNIQDLVGGITITAWVRPNDKTQDSVILAKKCAAGDNGYHLRTNTRIRFEWGNTSTQSDFELSTANIMVDDQWQHVAVTYDETTVKFYRNGALQGSVAHAGTMAASTEPITIGAAGCGGGSRADADVDGIRIYNRALTATEITQVYTDGS